MLMRRTPPHSTRVISAAASYVYKRTGAQLLVVAPTPATTVAWAHLIATVLQRLQVPACVRLPDECTCLVCIGGPFPALTALADYFLACRPHTPTLPRPLLGKFDLFSSAEAAFWASAEGAREAQIRGPNQTYRVDVFLRDCPPLELNLLPFPLTHV